MWNGRIGRTARRIGYWDSTRKKGGLDMVSRNRLAARLAAIERQEAMLYAIADVLETAARMIRKSVEAIRREREGTE